MLDASINSIRQDASVIQSVLSFFAYLFLGIGLRKDFKGIKYRSLKVVLLIVYCSVFRILLYHSGLPSSILGGHAADPAYFSSAFGGGIVKSPAEFFVTNIFLIIICLVYRILTIFGADPKINRLRGTTIFSLPAYYSFCLLP
jgi:hypothetical protein